MFDWDVKKKESLATVVGLLVALASILGFIFVEVPVWVAFIVFGMGLFLVFPYRIKEFFSIINDKLPTFKKD
jgi:hypothetical protein